jgi:plastocyanin
MHAGLKRTATLLILPALALSAIACGDDGDDGDARATAPVASATDTPATAPAGDPQRLEIAAENSESFTTDELSAEPGDVTVVFENREDGVIHNIHFFAGSDSSDESVAETDLTSGPDTQEVTFTVEAGEYFYHCDTHPVMQGTLTVGE